MYKIGRMTFPSKEHYERLLKTRLVKEFDFSPKDREKHDLEAKRKREEFEFGGRVYDRKEEI